MKNRKTKNGLLVCVTLFSMFLSNIVLAADATTPTFSAKTVAQGLSNINITDTTKGILTGSGVGALSKASVNEYLDNEEKELRAKFSEQPDLLGTKLYRDGQKIHIIPAKDASFNKNDASINVNLSKVLDSVIQVVSKYNSTVINITGNADGTEQYQNQVALERADNVVAYLQHKGIPFERLQASSNGARNPLGNNEAGEERKLNRRVDITLITFSK